ncbi:hypothetical protein BV22DRAFT_189352 [Leucogyrophana mollusca]|uniref:Uncharacterized protein n=1 Tax=Leucogyrophana mollusca TaxID=85980 RepID=A0ACB8BSV7_9AGAM|nr:hypothetical protein BV22DRAFT_189352 [Leucogyrophana mollusca]
MYPYDDRRAAADSTQTSGSVQLVPIYALYRQLPFIAPSDMLAGPSAVAPPPPRSTYNSLTPDVIVVRSRSLWPLPSTSSPPPGIPESVSSVGVSANFMSIAMAREDLEYGRYAAEGQLHVYRCGWDEAGSPCHLWVEGEKQQIGQHLHGWHNTRTGHRQEVTCLWDGCGRRMRKGSLARHIVTKHLMKKLLCSNCGVELAREDSWQRHGQQAEPCRLANPTPVHGPDARVVDIHALFGSGLP